MKRRGKKAYKRKPKQNPKPTQPPNPEIPTVEPIPPACFSQQLNCAISENLLKRETNVIEKDERITVDVKVDPKAQIKDGDKWMPIQQFVELGKLVGKGCFLRQEQYAEIEKGTFNPETCAVQVQIKGLIPKYEFVHRSVVDPDVLALIIEMGMTQCGHKPLLAFDKDSKKVIGVFCAYCCWEQQLKI